MLLLVCLEGRDDALSVSTKFTFLGSGSVVKHCHVLFCELSQLLSCYLVLFGFV